jgi:hypothetical protein
MYANAKVRRALMHRQPELIAARLMQASTIPPWITPQEEHQVTIMPPSPNFECEDDAPSQNSQEPLCMLQGELRTAVNRKTRIWFPTWFSNRVWEIQCQKAYSGWDFKLRTYNIVSAKSEIVDAIRYDNVEHMRRLFIEKQASPFDRTSYYDLLEVSTVQFNSNQILTRCVS